ncbi:MAG: ATP-binding protein, partial [Thermodesulfobacteriota bacterium]|nr:ATP-binding protein [Thermodesulfobacteriota bacterium]
RNTSELVHVWIDLFLCMKDPKTRSREITSLLCAMKELDLETGKIIILDEEKILKEGGKTVEIIPAWKYLLR